MSDRRWLAGRRWLTGWERFACVPDAGALDIWCSREFRSPPSAARAGRVGDAGRPQAALQFPELENLQEDVIGVENRDQKARHPIEQAAPDDVVPQEGGWGVDGHLERTGTTAFGIPFFGCERRVVIDARNVIGDVAIRI